MLTVLCFKGAAPCLSVALGWSLDRTEEFATCVLFWYREPGNIFEVSWVRLPSKLLLNEVGPSLLSDLSFGFLWVDLRGSTIDM